MEQIKQTETGISLKMGKAEKLRHKTLVDGLYSEGRSLYDFPLRVNYRALTGEELEATFRTAVPSNIGRLQMLITIPKKRRRRAVDRVLLRRRIREAYRLNRHRLREVLERSDIRTLGLGIVYIHNENIDYATIEKKLVRLLDKIAKELGIRQ